jgi:hypothetical protein
MNARATCVTSDTRDNSGTTSCCLAISRIPLVHVSNTSFNVGNLPSEVHNTFDAVYLWEQGHQ